MIKRTIYDIEEEKLEFLSNFLVDLCHGIDSDNNSKNLNGRIQAIEIQSEKYQYFLDETYPLLYVDLNLIIDGV